MDLNVFFGQQSDLVIVLVLVMICSQLLGFLESNPVVVLFLIATILLNLMLQYSAILLTIRISKNGYLECLISGCGVHLHLF